VAERERAELKKHRLPSQIQQSPQRMMPAPTSLSGEPTGALKGDQTYRSDKLYRRKLDRFLCPQLH